MDQWSDNMPVIGDLLRTIDWCILTIPLIEAHCYSSILVFPPHINVYIRGRKVILWWSFHQNIKYFFSFSQLSYESKHNDNGLWEQKGRSNAIDKSWPNLKVIPLQGVKVWYSISERQESGWIDWKIISSTKPGCSNIDDQWYYFERDTIM